MNRFSNLKNQIIQDPLRFPTGQTSSSTRIHEVREGSFTTSSGAWVMDLFFSPAIIHTDTESSCEFVADVHHDSIIIVVIIIETILSVCFTESVSASCLLDFYKNQFTTDSIEWYGT